MQAEPVAKEVARLRALFEAADKGMHASDPDDFDPAEPAPKEAP